MAFFISTMWIFSLLCTLHPMPGTEPIAREEFKSVFNHALFLASFEPVITPRQINNELVKMLEKARDLDNILFWNYVLNQATNLLLY